MKKILIIISIAYWGIGNIQAQDKIPINPFTISGYAELYYGFDFNKPLNNTRPDFLYSFNKSNNINLNLGFIKATYLNNRLRGNFALAMGTYMKVNLAAEPSALKNIFEGNIGVKLLKNSNLWLDAGIFPSHIGFESAIGKDCWNLTRSMLAENSPYYESGIKLSYSSANDKWNLSTLLLNGWQQIQLLKGNSSPSFGTQITYTVNPSIKLNSSSFIGNVKSDSIRKWRYFHNFYGVFQLTNSIATTIGFDIGAEQIKKGSSKMNSWLSPIAIIKFTLSPKISVACRAEYYYDKNGVIIPTGTINGFKTWGLSSNIDIQINKKSIWRIETRNLKSKDAIFTSEQGLTNSNTLVTTSFAISF